jgi:hypothetical protein
MRRILTWAFIGTRRGEGAKMPVNRAAATMIARSSQD